ncbi:unnamed protein product [Amoebophrya sp. A120]|nr:unnamed protein product [Amoebophrya sp. A120]|eukprot:GSA120T00000413001.1
MNMAIFTNMIQFMIVKCKAHPVRSKRPHFEKFGPCYLLVLATVLILTDLVRHLMNDAWGMHCDPRGKHQYPEVPAQYSDFCYSTGFAGMYNSDGTLNFYGVMFSIVFTWTGFACLFVGIFWGIDFHRKLRLQWRQLRGGRSGTNVVRNNTAAGPTAASNNDRPLLASV